MFSKHVTGNVNPFTPVYSSISFLILFQRRGGGLFLFVQLNNNVFQLAGQTPPRLVSLKPAKTFVTVMRNFAVWAKSVADSTPGQKLYFEKPLNRPPPNFVHEMLPQRFARSVVEWTALERLLVYCYRAISSGLLRSGRATGSIWMQKVFELCMQTVFEPSIKIMTLHGREHPQGTCAIFPFERRV